MSNSILLVEDSKEIYRLVQSGISDPLLKIDWAPSLSKANELFEQNKYDLALLDIGLPDGSGIELCRSIQAKYPDFPVFFLTSQDGLSEKILGFSIGADDYITKPFDPIELKARIQSRLKKIEIIKQSADLYKWKELTINKTSQEVIVHDGDTSKTIDLTNLEFKLLLYFVKRAGQVIDRDSILNEIWGEDIHVYARSVDTHVSKLRKKLGPVSHIIESIHGAGYKCVLTKLETH